MPKWGLTAAMRRTKPWGLEEDPWLLPGKVFTDPVHGDIFVNSLEFRIIDSPAFQRLRKVRQLGTTHLVYPGATHTRFSHSLGALRVAQDLMDVVIDQRSARDPAPDLFREWEIDLGLRDAASGAYSYEEGASTQFDQRVAEAIILARLGGLLHDLCHVPYGHSIEDELLILDPHDENMERFDRLWATLPDDARAVMDAGGLTDAVRPLIMSKAGAEMPEQFRFVEDVVGNTICADLLDYLRRDHLFTGLPLALGRRYEAAFYVAPSGDPYFGQRMILRIHREGQERTDAVSEILKHLRYRYELSERALFHHAKLAADGMVGKALEMWHDALWVEAASELMGADDAAPFPHGRDIDHVRGRLDAAFPAQDGAEARSAELDSEIQQVIDRVMTSRGDDSLLEDLATVKDADPRIDLGRRRAVAELAGDIETRRLFKRRASQRDVSVGAEKFHKLYGAPATRRHLERKAAAFAGLEKAWWVLVWLPNPKMKLKLAEVLVEDETRIRTFVQREEALGGRGRGHEIYEAHQSLWSVIVYMHRDVTKEQAQLVLASLSADLEEPLVAVNRALDPSDVYELPPSRPHDWRERIAASQLRKAGETSLGFDELAAKRRQAAARGEDAALSGFPSLTDYVAIYRAMLD